MSAWLLTQYVVIALAVVLSAGFVVKRQFPLVTRKSRIAMALLLLREGQPAWLQRVGRWIAPAPTLADPSCGGCNNCGPTKP